MKSAFGVLLPVVCMLVDTGHISFMCLMGLDKRVFYLIFNVHMEELSKMLNGCKTGCLLGELLINHLMYNLVIFCPNSARLQIWKKCSNYGEEFGIKFNSKKSHSQSKILPEQ